MALNYWPAPASQMSAGGQPMNLDNWARNGGLFMSSGIVGSPTGTSFAPVRNASGLFINAGTATLRGITTELTAQVQVAITTNNSPLDRLDMVVLRLDPTATPMVTIANKTGGPGAYPTPTQTATGLFEIPLCRHTVPSQNAVPTAAIVDARQFAGVDCVPVNHLEDVPTSALRTGQIAYSGGKVWSWNGTDWLQLAYQDDPVWTQIPLDSHYTNANDTWGGDTQPKVRKRLGRIEMTGMVGPKTGYFPAGTAVIVGTLPSGMRPLGRTVSKVVASTHESTGAVAMCRVDIRQSGTITVTAPSGSNVQKFWASLELEFPQSNQ